MRLRRSRATIGFAPIRNARASDRPHRPAVPRPAVTTITAGTTLKGVIADPAVGQIVTCVTEEVVIPGISENAVVASPAVDLVTPLGTTNQIIPRSGENLASTREHDDVPL